MAHQSLYRRYRPRRFSELRGQDHVVRALRNSLSSDTVGHAYLFSGPRGTGKTTTARILAKALNCTNLQDGEPCGLCESCVSMDAGTSYDMFELDAASNNRVETMRELVSSAAVGSPGRRKVYILDEVHMLSAGAANTLLKTLEEPPEHVVFVLATTDPHKVLPTIRSRTQHFEFSLLSAEELEAYVRWIIEDADLTVDDAAIEHVVRVGKGSARDTLSALDQVVAAGGVVGRDEPVDEIVLAIGERDTRRAIVAVADAIGRGSDPRVLGEALLATLRDAFLAVVGADLSHLAAADREAATEAGKQIGTPPLTRSRKSLGTALVDMRQAADPRIPLEVALIRITDVAVDNSFEGISDRLERLERAVASGAPVMPASDGAAAARAELQQRRDEPVAPAPPAVPAEAPPPPRAPRAARPTSSNGPPPRTKAPAPAPAAAPAAPASPAAAATGDLPSVDVLSRAMADSVLGTLKGMSKAIYQGGRFVAVSDGTAVFALGNAPTRDRAEKMRPDVEQALAAHFGHAVPMRLIEEADAAKFGGASAPAPTAASGGNGGSTAIATPPAPASAPAPAPTPAPIEDDHDEEHDTLDVRDLENATDVPSTAADKLAEAFPGAKLVEEN